MTRGWKKVLIRGSMASKLDYMGLAKKPPGSALPLLEPSSSLLYLEADRNRATELRVLSALIWSYDFHMVTKDATNKSG